jgi:hypothetical protein
MTTKRVLAAVELLLVLPATLFMTALFVRNLQPSRAEPAHTAWRVVAWYSAHPPLGLDVFLIAMPFAALVVGGATLLRRWQRDANLRQAATATLAVVRAHLESLLVAGATVLAGGILAIVGLHVITD